MITLSYEALIALIGLCGGAGYLLGKDITIRFYIYVY